MESSARVRKLKWLCRRGMKELDVLLERFVAENRASLDNDAWPELESLLREEDDALWDWLQDAGRPAPPEYQALLRSIRGDR
jgi:antitoxin CptB